jgi:uncharacterized membrane protein
MSRMGGFETSVVVRRPLEEVAAYLSDLQNDPQWRREWVDAEPVSAGPLGVGTTTALLGEVWGRRMKAVYEVARYEPNRQTEWRTVSGPLPLTFRRGFQEAGGGTRVTFTYDAQPSAVLKLVEPIAIRMGRRQLDGDIPGLRAILEGKTSSPAEAAAGTDPATRAGTGRTKRVEARVWIDRPVQDVFAYVTSLDQWPEWRRDVVGGRVLTEGDLRAGSRARGLAKVLGQTITIDVVVTVLEPGAAFGYRPVNGPLLTDNLYTFGSQDGGTLVTLTDDIRLPGIARVLLPVVAGLVRSAYRKNLTGLKAILEAQPPRPGGVE